MTTAPLSVLFGSGFVSEFSVSFSRVQNATDPVTKFTPITKSGTSHPDDGHHLETRNVTVLSNFGKTSTSAALLMDDETTTFHEFFSNVGEEDHKNLTLMVGIICGIVGIFVGIALASALCLYRSRSQQNRALSRSRHSSIFEKNPKETTFEPLDLSLTLPRYDHSQSALNFYQETSTATPTPAIELDFLENSSYKSSETIPTPKLPRHQQKFGTFPRGAAARVKQTFLLRDDLQKVPENVANDSVYCSKNLPFMRRSTYNQTKQEVCIIVFAVLI